MKELKSMADAESLLDLDSEMFSLHSLDVDDVISQEVQHTSRSHRHMRISVADPGGGTVCTCHSHSSCHF